MDYNTKEEIKQTPTPPLIAVGLGSISIGFWLTVTIILSPIGIPLMLLGVIILFWGMCLAIIKLFIKS